MHPSIHQPSSTLKLGTPLKAAFMPLVLDASKAAAACSAIRLRPIRRQALAPYRSLAETPLESRPRAHGNADSASRSTACRPRRADAPCLPRSVGTAACERSAADAPG